MELRSRFAQEYDKRKEGLLIFAILLGFGFFINRSVELKGLYMDDLYLWSCYGEQTFGEFVFPMGSTRFRFIFYLAAWLELLFLGNHVELMVPFNIVLNAGIAFSIFKIAMRMSRERKIISLTAAVAYLLSRMSYYQIGQFYGLMESLGLWAALGLLYCVWRYANERNTGAYLAANLLYFLASFIHERYLVLMPVLLLGLIFGAGAGKENRKEERRQSGAPESPAGASRGRSRGSRSRAEMSGGRRSFGQKQSGAPIWSLFLVTVLVTAGILLIRMFTIGTLSPAGTGGTDVADTFSVADAVAHAWEQVAFVFGRNSGPDYLCMKTYEDSPENIKNLIWWSNAVLGICVAVFVLGCVRDLARNRSRFLMHLKTTVLFLAFIALCIGSSSVTIRVEMRWIYVVYAAALLFLTYMSSVMGKAGILIILYAALIFRPETYYRDHWDNLYLWPDQLRYNSLAEETVLKYGEDIFDKQIYIIGNDYGMSEFTAETFLKVYDRDHTAANTVIRFIDSDFDFKTISDDTVILWEDKENNAYKDVTEFVRQQRRNYASGSYSDGWVDEHAKIVLMNGNTDVLKLGCYYPGTITGNQVCQIRVNGKQMPDLVFTEQYMTYEIPSAPYQMITLEFSCNFHVVNAKEKRGEENLAMVVTIGAK